MSRYHQWTADDDTALRFMYAESQPLRSIAERIGISESQVERRARKLALVHPKSNTSAAGHREAIYNAFLAAAKAGKPCPGNKALAEMLGIKSLSAVSRHIQLLEEAGRFTVKRTQDRRLISFPELGVETKASVKAKGNYSLNRNFHRVTKVKRSSNVVQLSAVAKKRTIARLKVMQFKGGGFRPKTCQWIDGEPTADAEKCGKPVLGSLSYCENHAMRCYRQPEPLGARA